MAINEPLLTELKYETTNTRKMLERVPTDKFSWKPHDKSFTLGHLASHIAGLLNWMAIITNRDELDFAKDNYKTNQAGSNEELLKIFDENLVTNTAVLQSATDDILNSNWTMRRGEHVFFTIPKKVALRSWVFNHTLHHRGQLAVYLRLLDIPVPGMYGPSADEM